jgi:hypothetical protein
MILHFPDLDTLRLALTSGAVPPGVSLAAAKAGFDDKGQLWLQPSVAPSKTALAELRKLGVQSPRTSGAPLTLDAGSWLQVVPVQRNSERTAPPEQTPVLFDVAAGQLSGLVSEILRLGNDRQSFRTLRDSADDNGEVRVLLRVVGPPYYSLLRALDREGQSGEPVAYIEAAPRVWVQVGYTHPFSGLVKVPDGKLLLIQPPRQWSFLDDVPFRDIYDVLEFRLPHTKTGWQDTDLGHRLTVPLRLAYGGTHETAELWVLRERPVEQLDQLVSNADDLLLKQLSFAVAEKDGQTIIVLRVRPSKHAAPVLVLPGAVAFRSFLKLPNLFLPVGSRLHPPLRRDAVRKLLADDPAQITWLFPDDNRTFTPETLPDAAFRPLPDWIDYVFDHDAAALRAWVEATQFEFEEFVCNEDDSSKPRKPPGSNREKSPRRRRDEEPDLSAVQNPPTKGQAPEERETAQEFAAVPKYEPNLVQQLRKALEERFLRLEGPLDSPERQAFWPELAELYTAPPLNDDAGLCWANTLWHREDPPGGLAWKWFASEAARVAARSHDGTPGGRSWAIAGTLTKGKESEVGAADLDRVLALEEPASADVRTLAAYVYWAAQQPHPPAALVQRLGKIRHFLEANEIVLPVRAVWLAWTSLVRLSDRDVLGLARTRDRLLERLFQNGLRPEQDLPSFLRYSGQPSSDRFRAFRQWMLGLPDKVQQWVNLNTKDGVGPLLATEAYADLIFAFGVARLGESDSSRALLQRAQGVLQGKDNAHALLLQAFSFRIQQALEGKPHTGPLPADFLQAVERRDNMEKYLVNRLRQDSRILEPVQKIDAYSQWLQRTSDLDRALAELEKAHDPAVIPPAVEKLLHDLPHTSRGNEDRARILRSALNLAPRVGEEFAVQMLALTTPAFDRLPAPKDQTLLVEQAALLEKGMFVAAHFDRTEYVQLLVARFQKLLQSQKGAGTVQSLDSLAGQCFRGLRKLGMRDEIDLLLRQMADLILESQQVPSLAALVQAADGDQVKNKNWLAALRALLHLAAGWYYFGREDQAEPVLKAARTVLLGEKLLDPNHHVAPEQAKLACTYIATLGQVPPEAAQKRLDELFDKLRVRDTFTTGSHYKLFQLHVIESVVLAVVTDDFSLGSEVRRWLDEDEFLVRQRIHRDLRTLMAQDH